MGISLISTCIVSLVATVAGQGYLAQMQGAPSMCPQYHCPTNCAYGTVNEQDQNGCTTCKCVSRPKCPDQECERNTYCPLGYKRINGCILPTCECNQGPCPPLQCESRYCPEGFAKDYSGPGCPTCHCRRKRKSLACPKFPCHDQIQCDVGVPLVVKNKCPICVCDTTNACPPLSCAGTICPFGPEFVDGCPTCNCNPIQPIQCPPLINCPRKDCSLGFASTIHGCPTCNCNSQSWNRGLKRQYRVMGTAAPAQIPPLAPASDMYMTAEVP